MIIQNHVHCRAVNIGQSLILHPKGPQYCWGKEPTAMAAAAGASTYSLHVVPSQSLQSEKN
jgi:hypothetical protein